MGRSIGVVLMFVRLPPLAGCASEHSSVVSSTAQVHFRAIFVAPTSRIISMYELPTP